MAYIGKNLVGVLNEGRTVDTMTGDNSTTTLALSRTPGSMNNVLVFIDGIRQTPDTDYTLSGSTLTFTTAPETGVSVSVISGNDTAIVPDNGTVSSIKLVDGSITDSKIVGMSSSKLSGTLPALDASALTGIAKPYTVIAADPTITTNPAGGVGSLYVNSTSGEVYICTDATTDNNVWTNVGGGSGDVAPIPTLGGLWATGGNWSGMLGNGTTTNLLAMQQSGSDTDWRVIAGFKTHAAAIKSDGTLWTWGDGAASKLGHGNTTSYHIPTKVGTDTNWVNVGCGEYHTIAIKSDGTLWAWGDGGDGKLGQGNDSADKNVPTQVGTDTDWNATVEADQRDGFNSKLGVGTLSTHIIKTDGTLWAFGGGSQSQLGVGDTNQRNVPTQVGTDTNWRCVSESYSYNQAAIKTDGTLWVWGTSSDGNLGRPQGSAALVPEQLGTETDWKSVSVGYNYGHAINTSGQLWGWGRNTVGQVGTGNTSSPINTITRINHSYIGVDGDGWSHTCNAVYTSRVMDINGRLWTWGENSTTSGYPGIAGHGNAVSYLVPSQVYMNNVQVNGQDVDDNFSGQVVGGYMTLTIVKLY